MGTRKMHSKILLGNTEGSGNLRQAINLHGENKAVPQHTCRGSGGEEV
jgi:hypothetical protein